MQFLNVSKTPCKFRTSDVFMLHYSSVQIKVDLVFLFSFKLKALNTNKIREWISTKIQGNQFIVWCSLIQLRGHDSNYFSSI